MWPLRTRKSPQVKEPSTPAALLAAFNPPSILRLTPCEAVCDPKWPAPVGSLPPGPSWCCVLFGKRTRKPNSVQCGHSSRRRVAADAHQRPTRRFRHCMEQPDRALRHASSRLNASGRCAAPNGSMRALPSLFGLAPCGVYPAPGVTAGAVRSCRTFSPLPWR